MKKTALAAFVLLAVFASWAAAADFYVAPNGDDANPGTLEKPFKTLGKAQKAVRGAKAAGDTEAITVYLRGGVYYLPETLVLEPADSGTDASPVEWRAYENETPVVSGGQLLTLKWEPYKNGIFKAAVPARFITDQLFVNGQQQPMARYPNYDAKVAVYNGYAADAIAPARVAKWADPTGGFIHAMHEGQWGGMHYRITGKKPDGSLAYEGGWQNNRPSGMHPTMRFVENIFEELDSPGEWFFDSKTNTLYYNPPAGMNLDSAKIESVRLRSLVEFRGTQKSPVRFIRLNGLTFRHAARTFMETREPLLRSDWAIYRGGALFVTGTEYCSVINSDFDHIGGNAIFVNNYNRIMLIYSCHIVGAGASGVAFVGDRDAARVPRDWNDKSQNLKTLDRTPGPKTDNYPGDCLVSDCLIHETGRVEKQSAGVEIDLAKGIDVADCSIYDVPRAGINIGDGCWGGHTIDRCDVFNTVLETSDHGSFNSWGRDRFWNLPGLDLNDPKTWKAEKKLPFLDAVDTTTICNSRWRCDHGWDIDLDDGSSNYRIYNNLCLRNGLKLREGFHRTVENNIIVGNGFHSHVWYKFSQDVFAHNILAAYYPIGMPPVWGKQIDFNFFTDAKNLEAARKFGGDKDSAAGDPMFVDPAHGDYRVKEGSPALKLGFQNFPMDQFGVKSPRLKLLAKTPLLPGAEKESATAKPERDARKTQWLGATVKNVTELGEVSVGGLPGLLGVMVYNVPTGSDAAKFGLKETDVIRTFDSKPADELKVLETLYYDLAAGKTVKVGVVRSQKVVELTITRGAEPRPKQ